MVKRLRERLAGCQPHEILRNRLWMLPVNIFLRNSKKSVSN